MKIMKKRLTILFFAAIAAVCLGVGLSACGSESDDVVRDSSGKQVPVYQGMVISSADTATTLSSDAKVYAGGTSAPSPSAEATSPVTGDVSIEGVDIDTQIYVDGDDTTIEDEIEATFGVTGTGKSIYYADSGEDIFVTVKLSNPDKFEIMSFVLNGEKYTSYMFESGSNLENLIVKLNVGTKAGFSEYTIDEIKYVDGTEIKDVLLDGDTTVKCGVRTDNLPYATVTNEAVTLDEISMDVKVTDLYSLISESDGYCMAVLFDGGENTIYTRYLEVGTNTLTFSSLKANTVYQYAVFAVYDDLSGAGVTLKYLYTENFKTKNIVLFDNVEVTKTGVSFSYLWYEGYKNATINHLSLESEGEIKLQSFDNGTTEIDGLLSNHGYTLTASYIGLDGSVESIHMSFTTLAMETPEVAIDSLTSTKTDITYSVSVTDEDMVGNVSSVEVTRGGEIVSSGLLLSGTVSNLLSDNEYTLTVTYTYDLNDGYGDQTLEVSKSVSTLAKSTPVVSFDSITSSQTEICYSVSVTDEDDIGSLTSVRVYHGEDIVATGTSLMGEFTNLLSDNEYTVVVEYTYDANDGRDYQTIVLAETVNTLAKNAPVVEIQYISGTTSDLTFCVSFADTEGVGKMTNVSLYYGGSLISETGSAYTGEITYQNLESYTSYTLVVAYEYDLNDGAGTRSTTMELSAKTNPEIKFNSISIRNTSAVSEGETIVVMIGVDNPSKAEFSHVVINGEEYEVSPLSNSTTLYVEIYNDGQFKGGDTVLTLTRIVGSCDGIEYAIDVTENNSASIFINGNLFVLGFSVVRLVDGKEEDITYAFKNDQVYYKVEIENPTDYEIFSVSIDSKYYESDMIFSDDKQTIYILSKSNNTGWCDVSMSSIVYGNDSLGTKEKRVDLDKITYYRLSNDEIIEITTAEQLLDVNDNYYYKLMNDIDLSGYEWINMNNEMIGIFDGNGYAIINMTAVTTYEDTAVNIGLFSNVRGIVMNLDIRDTLYIITLTSELNRGYSVNAGGLSINMERAVLVNCNFSSSIQATMEYGGSVKVGAVSAECSSSDTTFYNIISEMNVVLYGTGNVETYGYFGNDRECGIYDSTINFKVSSEGTLVIDNCKYEYEDKNYCLTKYFGFGSSLVLPDSINGSSYRIEREAFKDCTSLVVLYIPNGVTYIENNSFENCPNLMIFVEAEYKPSGWDSDWNSGCTVIWGASSIPTENITFTFVTNGGSDVDTISAPWLTSMPTPTREGYAFLGWYTDAEFTGEAVKGPYFSTSNVTFYARWVALDDVVQSEGLEIVDGVIVGIGTCTDTILLICMPIADEAFKGCKQIVAVYMFDGCDSVGYRAFYSCDNLKTAYFYQSEKPKLGSDIFGNTWDASDFRVYVPSDLYTRYQNVSDDYWMTYLVRKGKLYKI